MINLTIDGKKISAAEGTTILAAAAEAGIRIPTLCHIKDIDPRANCRMCIVEVEKMRLPQPACATNVSEGMVVKTNTELIRKARKTNLELLLSRHAVDCHHCLRIGNSKCDDLDPHFCEMCFFCDCVRDGFCELQALAREYKVDVLPYEMEPYNFKEDTSLGSITRNPNKCVKCRRCVDVCNEVQAVHNLCVENRGCEVQIVPALAKSMKDSPCVQCGRCVDVCPTGAIYVKEHIDDALYYAHKYGVTTVAQISDNILAELGKWSKLDESADRKLVAAGLKKEGFDIVISEDFAQKRAAAKGQSMLDSYAGNVPAIITNSPAAVKFVQTKYPSLAESMLVYPSTQQELSEYVKKEWIRANNLDIGNIRILNLNANNENAADAVDTGNVDYVMNAREVYRMFLRTGVNLHKIHPVELDSFGEAGKLEPLFAPVTWGIAEPIVECEAVLAGQMVKAAITVNLGQADRLLCEIKEGNSKYQIIRINA